MDKPNNKAKRPNIWGERSTISLANKKTSKTLISKPTSKNTSKAVNKADNKSQHQKPSSPNIANQSNGIRLNKRMSELGLCSRREADSFIDKGKVTIDGELATHPGQRVTSSQSIHLDISDSESDRLTIALHKPVGYVSGLPEDNHEPALRLIRKENYFEPGNPTTAKNIEDDTQWPENFSPKKTLFPKNFKGLAPCGRLDINSEGLIIFSNDGRVAKAIISPDNNIDKEYLIRFTGECNNQQTDLLRHGIELDGKALKPAKVEQINESQLKLTLEEGKKRQIRRMCDIVELNITKLQRTRVGPIRLSSLPLGKWRVISNDEIEQILRYNKT